MTATSGTNECEHQTAVSELLYSGTEKKIEWDLKSENVA